MSYKHSWQLKKPIDTFFFDCDSTLSLIEGIDQLATWNGVFEKVHAITERCMAKTGLNLAAYRERLDLVQPTQNQVRALADLYQEHMAPGAQETIQALQSLDKKIYVISAGIKSAVTEFAKVLRIPENQVLAVDVYFDNSGKYLGFDEASPLVQPNGKSTEVTSVLKPEERSLFMGDGLSDWETRHHVTRFLGYAGLHPKEWLKNHSEFFISNSSFYSLLPLSLTEEESLKLNPQDRGYYEAGLIDLQNGVVHIQEKPYDYDTTS
jgi:phosphoserine phosphatase